jgi:hypothetical protein
MSVDFPGLCSLTQGEMRASCRTKRLKLPTCQDARYDDISLIYVVAGAARSLNA